jgi:hypothetical protein
MCNGWFPTFFSSKVALVGSNQAISPKLRSVAENWAIGCAIKGSDRKKSIRLRAYFMSISL